MQSEGCEELCARLCLLTRACWSDALPAPLTRAEFGRMAASGALQGLVLRAVPGVELALLRRAQALLTRVRSVCELAGRYEQRGYRALLPGQAAWPQALFSLGMQAPPFLFARGELSILNGARYAVAGSRQIRQETRRAARQLGRRIAGEGAVLVTGGAHGVDREAQAGALEAGGRVVLVPAQPDADVLRQADTAQALAAGRLLLLYDSLPDDPFSAQRALSRNHTIYALGAAAIVVAAREGVGGSWRGAADCLRGGWSPVLVCDDRANADMAGCRALLALGARALAPDVPLRAQQGGKQLRLC